MVCQCHPWSCVNVVGMRDNVSNLCVNFIRWCVNTEGAIKEDNSEKMAT